MESYEVLIAGGGLAGLSAAYHLKRLGVEGVAVVERLTGDTYRHYHRTCGEAVSDRMLRMADVPTGCIVRKVDTIRIACGGVDMDIPVKGNIIDRVALLDDLRAGCDAEMLSGSITGAREDGEGYVVSIDGRECRCRYLLGADGAFSAIRKRIFGTVPDLRIPAVNNIIEGSTDDTILRFEVSPRYAGAYRWDFPSADGYRSIGYPVGTDDLSDVSDRGIRYLVTGRDRNVVKGNCLLLGDAANLANPICYGGIGAALISGRKAAEAVAGGSTERYQRWVSTDRMFDRHFMDAWETFDSWGPEDYADSVKPFEGGYSVHRGAYAMMRRPKWANLYMAIWVAFRKGW